MTTVAAALAAAQARLPANEARILLGHVLDRPAAWLFAHDDHVLDEDAMLAFASLTARRAGGEPVAYLAGRREFFGRDFEVSPDVLIPRPETELLVDLVVAGPGADAPTTGPFRVLDLGTGSGCIAVTLALECRHAEVVAVDASPAALAVARRNAERLGARLELVQSDWFSALDGERFDVVVTNPPYVAAGDRHLGEGDLRFEPASALASGSDGLEAIRRIVAAAPAHLRPGGWLWLEHGYDQASAVRRLLDDAGFTEIAQHRDLAGIVRASGGRHQ